MALRFCANLNFLFCETGASVLDKFRLARQAGFVGVETGIPETISVEQAVAAQKENGVQVVLLNICLGKCIIQSLKQGFEVNKWFRMKKDIDRL